MSGKFSSPLAEALWDISLDSGHDDETGDVDTVGHYCLFYISPDELLSDLVSVGVVGAILHSDDQGFVDVTTYTNADALAAAWTEIERDYADALGEE